MLISQNEDINSCVYALIQLSGHSPKTVKDCNVSSLKSADRRECVDQRRLKAKLQENPPCGADQAQNVVTTENCGRQVLVNNEQMKSRTMCNFRNENMCIVS